ncbi:hypothetical protein [Cognatiluteimonas telluris]|uniref:hypothetical protein n=1 Tax=Cognatiluteimonas telluris TaxID=1104775 RepID=UPI001409B715|nr:hypothetical protein [Lysobacter telluris]
MALDDDLEKDWVNLNDLEMSARAKEDERPWRDVDENPWTDEDRAATHRIVQEMSGRLARIEQRQSVLFRTSHSLLRKVNNFLYAAATVLLLELARQAYKFVVN